VPDRAADHAATDSGASVVHVAKPSRASGDDRLGSGVRNRSDLQSVRGHSLQP